MAWAGAYPSARLRASVAQAAARSQGSTPSPQKPYVLAVRANSLVTSLQPVDGAQRFACGQEGPLHSSSFFLITGHVAVEAYL